MGANISGLHPALRRVAQNLPRVARLNGFNVRVTSGYRSPAKQRALYIDYINGRSQYPVSPPGTSYHEKGLAIDVLSDNTNALVSLLTSVGLTWAGPDDPIHFVMKSPLRAAQGQKRSAGRAYAEDVGYAIPSALSYLPIIGEVFATARDPVQSAKTKVNTLLDVVLGFL